MGTSRHPRTPRPSSAAKAASWALPLAASSASVGKKTRPVA